jgi:hypothetical protein
VRRGGLGYRPPPLPWRIDASDLAGLARMAPGVVEVRDLQPPAGRGPIGWLAPRLRSVPVLRSRRPVVVALRFGR